MSAVRTRRRPPLRRAGGPRTGRRSVGELARQHIDSSGDVASDLLEVRRLVAVAQVRTGADELALDRGPIEAGRLEGGGAGQSHGDKQRTVDDLALDRILVRWIGGRIPIEYHGCAARRCL